MYTERDLRNDLLQISTTYFVKFNLLNNYVYNRMSYQVFTDELYDTKDEIEVDEITAEANKIKDKLQAKGWKLDTHPIDKAIELRKSGQSIDAYKTILSYLRTNPEEEDAIITYGWVMYDFLKEREDNVGLYCKNLELFLQNTAFPSDTNNESLENLKSAYLWSIRRVANEGEENANKVFVPFLKLFQHDGSNLLANRFTIDGKMKPAWLLFQLFLKHLNTSNKVKLLDVVGFDWLRRSDYVSTTFTNNEGKEIEMPPLAEQIFNEYAKALIALEEVDTIKIEAFLPKLDREIARNPGYKWLPYHKARLLLKVNRKEEALEEAIVFARNNSNQFWVWSLISDAVPSDEKFIYLSKGLLCQTKPEMLVNLQEEIIPHLIKRDLFAEAKFEVDECIATRNKKGWKIPEQFLDWQQADWYKTAESRVNRDGLKEYAASAEKILYTTLPQTDIFITYINKEKGAVNFRYKERLPSGQFGMTRDGYFFTDSLEDELDLEVDQSYKVKMIADVNRPPLHHVCEILPGDPEFVKHFIKSSSGYVEKLPHHPFAFVDDVYIPPSLVKQYSLADGDRIDYMKKQRFNKKKNNWGWAVEKITTVTQDDNEEGHF